MNEEENARRTARVVAENTHRDRVYGGWGAVRVLADGLADGSLPPEYVARRLFDILEDIDKARRALDTL